MIFLKFKQSYFEFTFDLSTGKGVPVKNGKRHAGEIAAMALEFLDRAASLQPQSMPGVNIRLRIGIHSGSGKTPLIGKYTKRYQFLYLVNL